MNIGLRISCQCFPCFFNRISHQQSTSDIFTGICYFIFLRKLFRYMGHHFLIKVTDSKVSVWIMAKYLEYLTRKSGERNCSFRVTYIDKSNSSNIMAICEHVFSSEKPITESQCHTFTNDSAMFKTCYFCCVCNSNLLRHSSIIWNRDTYIICPNIVSHCLFIKAM